MAEYLDDLLPFSSTFLLSSLPHLHERVILDPSKPSGVRVFGRSMYMVAAGWTVAVGWLWLGSVQPHGWLFGAAAPVQGIVAAIVRLLPALVLVAAGWTVGHFSGRAKYRELNWREWRHACGWALVPNGMVLATVWMILNSAL
jgi:hypothetical protein